ncbi:MAG TPA: radical SAM family heme chaperone HemW [Rhizomicrobium sp.]|jgi:oxygen-independent coproporphyrinogen-3 oxidase|nr:radical SAM family heme chaperone HemW [Rhizomicrobium sp.]
MSAAGFGIYVHWPFCAAKCPYCDFNSHVRTRIDENSWTRAIASELAYVATELAPSHKTVTSVFFGGGTPSLMGGNAVGGTLGEIAKLWRVAADVEITLEANPASADAARFRDYREAGINRISLGIQALNDRDLAFLGRLHDSAEAAAAVRLATSLFERVSIDLIYGRPEQTTAQWRNELRGALAFGTEHLSLYQLTIEEGTPFAALVRTGALIPLGEEPAADLYETTQEIMEDARLPAYEISNHARPGRECRHNLLYWRYGCYAGVGPGAHGRLARKAGRIATATERLPERWLSRVACDRHGICEIIEVKPAEAAREHLLMNLRLAEGIDLEDYFAQWGIRIDCERVAALADAGVVEQHGARLMATRKGRLVLNAVISALAETGDPSTIRTPGMSSVRG